MNRIRTASLSTMQKAAFPRLLGPRPQRVDRSHFLAARPSEPSGFAGLPIRTSKDWDRESASANEAVEKIVRDLTESLPTPRQVCLLSEEF